MNRKKMAAIGGAALGALVLSALLAAPSFMDWSGWRAPLAQRLSEALGREVLLEGKISAAFLPWPTLSVEKAKIPPQEGKRSWAQAERASARLSLTAFLGGEIAIDRLTLAGATIVLPRTAEERMGAAFAGADLFASGPDRGPGEIREIALEKSTLLFAGPGGRADRRFEKIDGAAQIDGSLWRWDAKGDYLGREARFQGQIRLGAADAPLEAVLSGPSGEISVKGVFHSKEFYFTGRMDGETGDLAALAGFWGGRIGNFPAVSLTVAGDFFASEAGFSAPSLDVGLAGQEINGAIRFETGETPFLEAAFKGAAFDLDRLFAARPRRDENKGSASPSDQPFRLKEIALPDDLLVRLTFAFDQARRRGETLSNAHLSLDLEGGELLINQASISLPGDTDLSLFGFIVEEGGELSLNGAFEATSASARELLLWRGADLSGLPPDRLGALRISGDVRASGEDVMLDGVRMTMDGASAEGALFLKGGGKPEIAMTLALDRLDLDRWRMDAPAAEQPKTGAPLSTGAKDGLAILSNFDGRDLLLRARIGEVASKGRIFSNVALDAELSDGRIMLNEASIGDFAGAEIRASGGFFPKQSAFSDFRFEARAEKPQPLFKATGLFPQADFEGFDDFAIRGALDGPLAQLDAGARLELAGTVVTAGGRIDNLLTSPFWRGSLEASHADLLALIRLFAPDYRPGGELGAFAGSTRLETNGTDFTFSDLRLKLGPASLAGEAKIGSGPEGRPMVDLTLTADYLPIGLFAPSLKTASLAPSAKIRTGGFQPVRRNPAIIPAQFRTRPSGREPPAPQAAPRPRVEQVEIAPPWSTDPLPLAWMTRLDGKLALDARIIALAGLEIHRAKLTAELAEGRLTLPDLNGQFYGGSLVAAGFLTPDGDLAFRAALSDARIQEILPAMAGLDIAMGQGGGEIALEAHGKSALEMVESLSGKGSILVSDGVLKGVDLPAIVKMRESGGARGLIGLGEAARGGQTRFSSFSGALAIEKGVLKTEGAALKAEGGDAVLNAEISIPASTIDLHADFHIGEGETRSPPLGLWLTGSLSNPRRFVDVNRIQPWLLRRD